MKPFEINDEWYYHMRFRDGMKGVTPILTALPPKETLSRADGPHSGNPDVRAARARDEGAAAHGLGRRARRTAAAASASPAATTTGTGATTNFRKVVLNAIVWCADGEVPKNGVEIADVTLEDLEANQDEPRSENSTAKAIRKQSSCRRTRPAAATCERSRRADRAKPVVSTVDRSRVDTPGHAVEIDVDITGAKQLYLVVTDGGDGFGCDWADWAEPRLVGAERREEADRAQVEVGDRRLGRRPRQQELRTASR